MIVKKRESQIRKAADFMSKIIQISLKLDDKITY